MLKQLDKRDQKQVAGMAAVQMLVMAGVTALMLLGISRQIFYLSQATVTTSDYMRTRLALNSLLDFTMNGIKQQWCFNSNWLRDSTSCTLLHEGNVERLLLDNRGLNYIRQLMAAEKIEPPATHRCTGTTCNPTWARVNQIKAIIRIRSFLTDDNPLKNIIQPVTKFGVDRVKMKIERIDNPKQATKGREILLEISAEFLAGSDDTPAMINGRPLKAQARMLVFPRELNTFALILPRNLYLGDGHSSQDLSARGNTHLPAVDTGQLDTVRQSGGLRFESPVFVNGHYDNLPLPDPDYVGNGGDGTQSANTGVQSCDQSTQDQYRPSHGGLGGLILPAANENKFVPVTFVGDLVLGGGFIYKSGGSEVFSPETAGGLNQRFMSQLAEYDGLLGEISMDPGPDNGLYKLFQLPDMDASKLNTGDFDLCRQRVAAQSDLSYTDANQLLLKYIGDKDAPLDAVQSGNPKLTADQRSYKFRLQLGQINEFVPQIMGDDGECFVEFMQMPDANVITNTEANPECPWVKLALNLKGYSASPTPRTISTTMDNESYVEYQLGGNSKLKVSIMPRSRGDNNNVQKNEVVLIVEFENPNEIALGKYSANGIEQLPALNLQITAFDYGWEQGQNKRDQEAFDENPDLQRDGLGLTKTMTIPFKVQLNSDESQVVNIQPNIRDGYLSDWHLSSLDQLRGHKAETAVGDQPILWDTFSASTEQDLVALDIRCGRIPPNDEEDREFFVSFQSADWDSDFSAYARHSWGFVGDTSSTQNSSGLYGSCRDTYEIGQSYENTPVFAIESIVGRCIIKPQAKFFSGFLVCDEFEIEDRSEPLRIIGTVIAGKVKIHPNAMIKGIRWSSIHHPQAVLELRQKGILPNGGILRAANIPTATPAPGAEVSWRQNLCNDDYFATPMWNPGIGVVDAAKYFSCSPVSLRRNADPFTWTTVTPDCALPANSAQVVCQRRIKRLMIKELYRETTI